MDFFLFISRFEMFFYIFINFIFSMMDYFDGLFSIWWIIFLRYERKLTSNIVDDDKWALLRQVSWNWTLRNRCLHTNWSQMVICYSFFAVHMIQFCSTMILVENLLKNNLLTWFGCVLPPNTSVWPFKTTVHAW